MKPRPLRFDVNLSTTHLLGVEETSTGAITYTLVMDSQGGVLVRRKTHDRAWRNLDSEVIPEKEYAGHIVKGRSLKVAVAETVAELKSPGT